jgi:hypothetical protein
MEPRVAVVLGLASQQYGLVARWQAFERGWTPRMVQWRLRTGEWCEVQPGVYLVGGAPTSWRQSLHAAVLAAGPDALASHVGGGALWGFESITTYPLEVQSPRWLRRPRGDVRLHESQDLIADDYARLHGIPVTSPLRTVVDIGCRVTIEQLEMMAVEGIRRGWFTYRQLRRRHRQVARRGRNGAGPLREVLRGWAAQDGLAHSGWEIRMGRLIERLGFPRPVRQFRIVDPLGNFIAQVDFAYPWWQIAIEADSETWHTGMSRFHHDRSRWNSVRAAGWSLLTYTHAHYRHDPAHMARTLRATIDQAIARTGIALPPQIA